MAVAEGMGFRVRARGHSIVRDIGDSMFVG